MQECLNLNPLDKGEKLTLKIWCKLKQVRNISLVKYELTAVEKYV